MTNATLSTRRASLNPLALLLVFGAASFAAENYSEWSKSRKYRINTSASGAAWQGTVANFPLLVRIPAGDSVLTQAKAGGADIRFTKADSVTRIPHEIESWGTSGAAIWVLIDTIKGNTAQQNFFLRWGNAGAADSSKGAQVFAPANNFVGVWHMSGSANETDATGNGNTAVATNAPGSGAGLIGGGRTLSRDASQHFVVADHASLNFTAPALTMSAWVNATDWSGSSRIFQRGTGGDAAQYGLRETSLDRYALDVNATNLNDAGSAVQEAGSWGLVHAVVDATSRKIYLNGVEVASADYAGDNLAATTSPLHLGRQPEGANYFNGALDEMRLQKAARGPEWIALEFENQKASQTLVQIDPGVTRLSAAAARTGAAFSVRMQAGAALFGFSGLSAATVTVSDLHGRVVWKENSAPGARELAWNAAGVSNGVYLARLSGLDANGKTLVAERSVLLAR